VSDRQTELVAERLRILGQPVRLRIVALLAIEVRTVQEVTSALETTQQNVSQHLGILQRAGIVDRQKQGTRVRYRLADPHVLSLIASAEASLGHHLQTLSQVVGARPETEMT
jgi:DNA-binding transcriptional ArsR family regulator